MMAVGFCLLALGVIHSLKPQDMGTWSGITLLALALGVGLCLASAATWLWQVMP